MLLFPRDDHVMTVENLIDFLQKHCPKHARIAITHSGNSMLRKSNFDISAEYKIAALKYKKEKPNGQQQEVNAPDAKDPAGYWTGYEDIVFIDII